MSKAISNKLKTVLPTLISSQQTTYVKCRFIGQSGRLISDMTEISSWFNITGFLVTIDIEKVFDFGKIFITWIEILLKGQQSCVRNGQTTTQYFNLETDVRQDNPALAYLLNETFL